MGADFRYRGFLSYSHVDKKWADWLHRKLEGYRVPPQLRSADPNRTLPRNLRPIFRDREELASASSLPQVIDRALAESESLIVICSPAAAHSHWVDNEIRRFRELGRGDRIFCLIVDGEPLAGDERDCFPPSLRRAGEQNSGAPLEPIAADARGGRAARDHARTMVIAGLLGVGLDELLQRDLRNRHRKMFAIATGTTLLAVSMAGLTIFSFLVKAESERRRADAENLVGFMLGDLRDDLHSIGRLDLYQTVADQAMEYFQSLDKDDSRDELLSQRALALRQIGTSRLYLGNLPGAREAFEEALRIDAAIAERNPKRTDWQLALAESHYWMGDVHWQLGEYDDARAQFLDQLAVVDALAAANPEDPELLTHSGYAWTNFGRILERNGQFEDALVAYQKVMESFQTLLAMQPESTDAILEAGFAHNNLGKLKISLGLLQEAEAHMRADLAIKRDVLDAEPGNSLLREYMAASDYWLSRVLLLRGATEEVAEHCREAVGLLDTLILMDSTQTRWRLRRADVSRLMATACRLEGRDDCAKGRIEASLADLEALNAINPENASWRSSRSQSALEAAWQAMAAGDLQSANALAVSAMATIEILTAEAPADLDTRKLEIQALLTLGDLAAARAEAEAASSRWLLAQRRLDEWFKDPADPEVLDAYTLLLERQGRHQEAKVLGEALDDLNYRSAYPDRNIP